MNCVGLKDGFSPIHSSRYPYAAMRGFVFGLLILAVVIGFIIGFGLGAACCLSPKGERSPTEPGVSQSKTLE